MTDIIKKHVLTVFTNPVAGQEEEYNTWYNEVHLADVLRVPGFISAQRFEVAGEGGLSKYLAIYEFEAVETAEGLSALMSRAGTPDMIISPAMDMSTTQIIPWRAITDKLES